MKATRHLPATYERGTTLELSRQPPVVVALNVGGAVGDILAALCLLREDAAALVHETGDAITIYQERSTVLGWRA